MHHRLEDMKGAPGRMISWMREIMVPRRQSRRQILRNLGLTLLLLGAASFVCLLMMNSIGNSDSAVPLVFVLAVLVIARLTDGYFYSFVA